MEEGFADLTVIKEMFAQLYRRPLNFKYYATDITSECVSLTNQKIENHEYYRQFVVGESGIQILFIGNILLCLYNQDVIKVDFSIYFSNEEKDLMLTKHFESFSEVILCTAAVGKLFTLAMLRLAVNKPTAMVKFLILDYSSNMKHILEFVHLVKLTRIMFNIFAMYVISLRDV